MQELSSILSVEVLEDYNLLITFEDGFAKKINIKSFIKNGVSSSLNDRNFFKQVKVENGYITWPNGFDFCPEFLRNYL